MLDSPLSTLDSVEPSVPGANQQRGARFEQPQDAALPRVLVYTDPLLAPSVTFVRSQAESLRTFLPYYAGARAVRGPNLALPKDRTILINPAGSLMGKIREIPFKVFGFAPRFYRRVRNVRPVLIHAHGGPSALTVVPMANWLGLPLIVTFHGSDVTVEAKRLKGAHYTAKRYWKRVGILQQRADLCIAVSNFIHAKLIDQGYSPRTTVMHYIGVDTDYFTPSNTSLREPIVLFVGTLHEVKGCEYLIRAMKYVQSIVPEAQLVVVGDGPLRASLENLASREITNCIFLGTQPPEIVRDWMDRARVFCVPSITAKSGATEALGLVFLEAQAMGVPVASFRSGGIPEAVAHDETGLLVSEGDTDSLSQKIILLLTNSDLWTRMSKAGRKRVQAKFDLARQTNLLESLYRQVIANKLARTLASPVAYSTELRQL